MVEVVRSQVHGLFTNEELDSTLAPLKEVVASQALLGQNLFSVFTAQVQRNLRIIISMDPSSPEFQHQCQANPALFSRFGYCKRLQELVIVLNALHLYTLASCLCCNLPFWPCLTIPCCKAGCRDHADVMLSSKTASVHAAACSA